MADGNVKSTARSLCPPDRVHEFQGWEVAYVRDTVESHHVDDNVTALGAPFRAFAARQ